MKTRYFFTLSLAAAVAYLLGPGCTQDFNAFQACGATEKLCDGACVPLTEADFGCGSEDCSPCSVANATPTCDGTACGVGACTGTFENCNGVGEDGCEVNVMANPTHCGACGNTCVVPHASAACNSGDCSIEVCDTGFDDCDGMDANGCEADLGSDPNNCGSCGFPCLGAQTCQNGQCTLECPPGTSDCDMDASNGCETQLGTTANCAFCGDSCNLPNAAGACVADMCVVDTCNPGFDDCDGMDANGCEADILNSAMTCGTCNNACPAGTNGTSVCTAGQCDINCNAGFDNCDGDVVNGCEADVASDLANCGACNTPCNPANGTGTCIAGMCQVSMCTAPFADCDGMAANGCEVNTLTDVQNCGMCGMGCSFPNAVVSCNNGMCAVGSCNAGFGDCDMNPVNGCEANTTTDAMNCGTCGTICASAANATGACTNSVCGLICDAGFASCDGSTANGCETNINNNINNCGSCGRACSGTNVASRSCTAGLCDSTCALGFANCSQPITGFDNGCETNVSGNNTSCGGCGNNCGQQGNPNNGFECDLNIPGIQDYCGCSTNAECDGEGNGAMVNNTETCSGGLCQCSGSACLAGEDCVGEPPACSCNGGAGCGVGEICCQTPGGCVNPKADAQNCGGCGHACPPGFACFDTGATTPPECRCDDAADCGAGTSGTFSCSATGRCVCNGATCAVGQRCQPNGNCG